MSQTPCIRSIAYTFRIAIKLDVGASATLTGRAEAHLIPRIDIGVEILNGLAQATVFANVDASAGLGFTLEAKTSGTPVDGTVGSPNVDFANFESSFGGSVGLDLGVSINVGAEAALGTSAPTPLSLFQTESLPEPFFNTDANFEVFQRTFPLFEVRIYISSPVRTHLTSTFLQKKFGDQARKRSLLTLDAGRLVKRALICPGPGEEGPKNSVVDATTQATR